MIWVWLGRDGEGGLAGSCGEVFYEGFRLAEALGVPLEALALGAPAVAECRQLACWGIRRVHTLAGEAAAVGAAAAPPPAFASTRGGLFGWLAALPAAARPAALLCAADSFGRGAAPLFAAALGGLCVPNAVGVQVLAEGSTPCLQAVRPVWSAALEALLRVPAGQPLVASLLPGAVGEGPPPFPPGTQPLPQVVPLGRAGGALRCGAAGAAGTGRAASAAEGWLPPAEAWCPPQPEYLALEDAERIVAFGRGAFSAEAQALVRRLAEALGAVVAGTRPAADEGWLPFERQIGLTGAIVQPRLYVAVGLSGAPYHMVGVREPETLIAINSDGQAPIFSAAQLGVVGDLHAVLPRLLALIEGGNTLEQAMGA